MPAVAARSCREACDGFYLTDYIEKQELARNSHYICQRAQTHAQEIDMTSIRLMIWMMVYTAVVGIAFTWLALGMA